jgi:hypothetical protein
MSSSVHFKFKSQKEPSRVTFDGTGISVFELKREIISQSRLGDGSDFELSIYNEDTREGMLLSHRTPYLSDPFQQNMMMTQRSSLGPHQLLLADYLQHALVREVLLVMSPERCQSMLAVPPATNRR